MKRAAVPGHAGETSAGTDRAMVVPARDHYERMLAPIYEWMCGGLDVALRAGRAETARLPAGPGVVVDLGAGFGKHAIPLAEAGHRVVAVDLSAELLRALARNAAGLPIHLVQAGILDFTSHLDRPALAILCMGDTLCHLADRDDVRVLVRRVAESLMPGGVLLATFRDYGDLPCGATRFVTVRGDADRILTCMLRGGATHVDVHDLLHERTGGSWRLSVSAYRKTRIDPRWLVQVAVDCGLDARLEDGATGLLTLVATRTDAGTG